MTKIINTLKELPSKALNLGKDIVQGMIDGVKNMASKAVETIKNFGKNLINGAKSVLGIASPSKVFAQLGEYTAEGFSDGFSSEMKDVTREMKDAIPTSLDVDTSLNGGSRLGSGYLDYQAMVNAFKEALKEVDVVLDDRQVGRFVKKTVENAIYT